MPVPKKPVYTPESLVKTGLFTAGKLLMMLFMKSNSKPSQQNQRRGGNAQAEDQVLVKLKKPGQERRADLPTIGTVTISGAAQSGLIGIAVEAGSTLILGRENVAAAADKAGLFVYGIPSHRLA